MGFRMIDIGCNLVDPVFRGIYRGKQRHGDDLVDVLGRAFGVGVAGIVVTAGTLQESRDALGLIREVQGARQEIPRLWTTVGVHPTRCDEFEGFPGGSDRYLQELLEVLEDGQKRGHVVAVGECGLDYERVQFCSKETQLRNFPLHFKLTEQSGLPLFLHNRESTEDLVGILRANRSRYSKAVVHSFTGTREELAMLLEDDLGLSIGINGCSLKTKENLEVVAEIPLERLLIETDAPWCDIRTTHASHSLVKTHWDYSKKPEKHSGLEKSNVLVKGRTEPCQLM